MFLISNYTVTLDIIGKNLDLDWNQYDIAENLNLTINFITTRVFRCMFLIASNQSIYPYTLPEKYQDNFRGFLVSNKWK